MFLRETTIGGSFVRVETLSIFFATIEIVEPITMLAHLFLPVCHHLIGRQYVTCSVIGWKLFTLQDVEALPSVCTESWLPTQWVNRPKQCPTPPSYWIPREPRVWLSSQCWPWHGWRDSHQDFSLSSDSRASSTSSIHGRNRTVSLLLQLVSSFPATYNILDTIKSKTVSNVKQSLHWNGMNVDLVFLKSIFC